MEKTFDIITNEFRFYMLWDEYRVDNLALDVTKKDDVILAIRKAYIDMTVRTIDGLGLSFIDNIKKEDKKSFKDNIKNCITTKENKILGVKEWLAKEIVKIFKGERKFEHTKLCDDFLIEFKSAIDEINKSIQALNIARQIDENSHTIDTSKIHFGKAQKIVNMTFKYLMLFDNAQKYEEIFKQCHMPIDSYIIDYFNTVENLAIKKSWSNFDEKSDYTPFQNSINKYCKGKEKTAKGTDLTGFPLYDEFTIWHEGKNIKNT